MQLTFFRCGGVCLGTAIHHTVADGLSSLHFISSWSSLTHTHTPLLVPPYINNTHLRACSPPSITSTHFEYSPRSPSSTHPKPFISTILKLSNHQLSLLKTTSTNNNNPKPPLSTFKAIVSHLWWSLCRARGLDASTPTRLYFGADARSRLRPPLPASYFGNPVFRTSVEATAGEVLELGASDKIDAATKRIDDEYVRSLVDYLEGKVDALGVRKGEWVLPETDVWATSWLGLPIYDADFGWGKPFFVGRASLQFAGSSYILRSSPEEEEGGVSVAISVEEENMGKFKEIFYEQIGAVSNVSPYL